MFTLLTHRLRCLLAIVIGCVGLTVAEVAYGGPTSSITYTELYRDAIRNDPDYGPMVVPIVSSSMSVVLYTNLPVGTFSPNTPWDITFAQLEVSGYFSNDTSYVVGRTSASFGFIDPNTGLLSGSIFMSWQSDHLVLTVTTSSDFLDAIDYYTGVTQPISDYYDLTITVGKFVNTATVFLSGRNTHRFDPATQLDLDSGNIVGKADFVPPLVSIQSPGNLASANSAVTISGTAADNVGVSAVMWRWAYPGEDPSRGAAHFDGWNSVDVLNIPDFGLATLATWKTTVDMNDNGPGTNRFWVVSQDPMEHFSPIQTRQFFYSVPSPLTLQSTDGGRAVGGPGVANNAMLIIDRPYSVTAIPSNRDNIFLNWTDGDGAVVSITSRYNFLMQDGLTLQANFGANPFPAVAGLYNGLVNPSNGVSELDSGLISVSVTADGLYTGKILLESGTYSFSGQFGFYGDESDPDAADGSFQVTIKGSKPILGSLHIAGDGPSALKRTLTGQLSIYDARLQKRVISVIDAGYSPGTTGSVPAGLYNVQLPSSQGTTQIGPLGCGYASVNLRSNALATTTVTLADQTPVASCSSGLTEDGSLPLFVSAYGGKGLLIGWLTFTNDASSDVRGANVHWIKRRNRANTFYPDGFHRIFDVAGCRYVAPKAGTNILGWTAGTVSFGDFGFNGIGGVSFDPKLNRFSFPNNPDNFRVSFSPTTGIITGTFSSSPALPVRAILLPKVNTVSGFYLNQNQSGFVTFSTP